MVDNIERTLTLDVNIRNSRFTQVGFGRAAIFDEHTHWGSDRTRIYTEPSEMLDDGFLTSDQAYIDATALMNQSPSPVDFMVAKRDAPVSQVWEVTIVTVVNSHLYDVVVDPGLTGLSYTASYTSDGSATAAEIRDGLVLAVNAFAAGFTAAPSGANLLTITADNPGIPMTVTDTNGPELTEAVTVANHGIAEDIDLAIAESNDFYGVLLSERYDLMAYQAALKVQTLRKLLMVQSSDSDIIDTTYTPGTSFDLAARTKFANLFRTSVLYVSSDTNSVAAAWMGVAICQVPGKITWKFKELTIVTPEIDSVFDGAGYTNLTDRSANGFFIVAGRNITFEGTVASGEFIDIIHGTDHLYSLVQRNVMLALIRQTDKVGMTQPGIDTIAAAVDAAMHEKMIDGLIARSRTLVDGTVQAPAYTVTPPRIQDLSPSDRAARRIPANHPIVAEGTLEGAIHFVDVDITVSV